jgi:hypothetical protein
VNVHGRVQRWRRPVRIEADARDLRCRTVTCQRLLRPCVHTGNRQDLRDLSVNAAIAEQHQDFVADLWIDQALIGNVPVHKDIGRIEDFGDRSARDQRLADMRETCRDYSGDRRKHPPAAEMVLHLVEAASKLLDEFIQGGELNGGFGDLRLLRDNGFARRGAFAQDFHAESDGGRGHGIDAFRCLLGHAQI